MRRTIYVKSFHSISNHFNVNRRGNILGNYSCYSKLFYRNEIQCLSRVIVPSNFLSRSMISDKPATSECHRFQSTIIKDAKDDGSKYKKEASDEVSIQPLSRKEKLKKAVKEYGSTVIVFHIGISLISLGTSYLVVSSGLDVTSVFETLGLPGWGSSNTATNAGTFAVAYAIHKVFAPVRITITLACVPFIVRYLRRIGFLKK